MTANSSSLIAEHSAILTSISDAIIAADRQRRIVFLNPAAEDLTGHPAADALGAPIADVFRISGDDGRILDRCLSDNAEPERGGAPRSGRGLLTRRDGSQHPIAYRCSPILDGAGTQTGVVLAFHDGAPERATKAVADLFHNLGASTNSNIDTIVHRACDVLGGTASLYNRLDERNRSLIVWTGHNLPPDMPRIDEPDGHICYEATIKGQHGPVAIGNLDATRYVQTDANVAAYGLKAYLGAPVHLRDHAIGALAVVFPDTREFSASDIDHILILARALSLEEERHAAIQRTQHLHQVVLAIRHVNQLIVMEKDAHELVSRACSLLVETRGYLNAWIALLDEQGQIDTVVGTDDDDWLPVLRDRLERGDYPACARRALRGSGVITIRDPAQDCEGCPHTAAYTLRSVYTIRISHGDRVYGWLTLSLPEELADDDEERLLVTEVADDLGLALHGIETDERHRQSEERLRYRSEFERLLAVISARFINLPTVIMDDEIQRAMGLIGEFADVDRSYVFLFDATGECMDNTHEWCAPGIEPQIDVLQQIPSTTLPWWMQKLRANEEINIRRLDDLPPEASAEREILEPQSIQSLLVVPIKAKDRLLGFLGFDAVRHEHEWTSDAVALVRMISDIIANALERKRAEEALRDSSGRYQDLLGSVSDSVYVLDHTLRFAVVNDAAARFSGISRERMQGARLTELFPRIEQTEYFAALQRVMASRKPETVLNEGTLSAGTAAWYEVRIYPVADGVLCIATDITTRKQIESERERYREDLRSRHEQVSRALQDTIDALSLALELRDPYTAGHQKRVTQIALLIARHMDMDADRVKGLRVAGMLHDVGKIAIPAEILSKPGRLSKLEMDMVRQHAPEGHALLKNILFEWPVADIVRQHHERQDGSGYPDGLAGDAILLEARILAVADVAEAMMSHRPYRAALGPDAALAEIKAGRGTRYDERVVDACIAAFAEGLPPGLVSGA